MRQCRRPIGPWAIVLWLGAAWAAGHSSARATSRYGFERVLNPKTYTSPSGEFAVLVDPSDRTGRGPASYRLTRNGREVWAGDKGFTLWDAAVADDGTVFGYAYSFGIEGYSGDGPGGGSGDFRVVIIDPAGRVRREHVTPRADSRMMHSDPEPQGKGLLLDAAHDRAIVRVEGADDRDRGEAWWSYRLADGATLPTRHPEEEATGRRSLRGLIDAKHLPGTPLFLLHWVAVDADNLPSGARFTLVDADARAVWTLDRPGDYQVPGDDAAEERLRRVVWGEGALLRVAVPGEFDLWFARESQRATWAARPDGAGGWAVREVARRAEPDRTRAAPAPEPPTRSLRVLGRVELRSPDQPPASPVRDVMAFTFNGRGEIAFLRVGPDRAAAVVVIDAEGSLKTTVPLEPIAPEVSFGWSGLAWAGGDRYVLMRPKQVGTDHVAEAWGVDAATGRAARIGDRTWPVSSEIAGRVDGGFVVLEGLRIARGGTVLPDRIMAYDARGAELWSIVEDGGSNDPSSLFSPEAIAVDARGDVAVVDVIRHLVQRFDRDGRFVRATRLDEAWGRKAHYPSGLAIDRDGGLVVHDSGAPMPLVRTRPDGTIAAEMRPTFADGRPVSDRSFGVDPDGRCWVSDGTMIARLGDAGVVDRTLGAPPVADRLGAIGEVVVDRRGLIYAVDNRSGAVHVFDDAGRWLRATRPVPADVGEGLSLPHLAVADDGGIYLGDRSTLKLAYLHFAPDGRQVGKERLDLDTISQVWDYQPGTGRRVVLGYRRAWLVDAAGRVVRTIERQPDRDWLAHPDATAFAPDGSFVISSRLGTEEATLNYYSATGDPVRTVAVPDSAGRIFLPFASDGRRCVAVAGDVLVILGAAGEVEGRFHLKDVLAPGLYGSPFLNAAGTEVWVFDHVTTLHRLALP